MKATELKTGQTFTIESTVLLPMVKTYRVAEKTEMYIVGTLVSAKLLTVGLPIELNVENLSKLIIIKNDQDV